MALPLTGCLEDDAPAEKVEVVRPVRVMTVADSGALRERSFSGRARAAQELDLAFNVSGPLTSLAVSVGDYVEQGDTLATIDNATYLAEAEQIEANLAKSEASLANADAQLKRQRILTEKGHQSEAALDRYVSAQLQASASVKANQAALNRLLLDLDYTTLKAPFSGVVTATYVENFENVREKQPVIRLLDSTRIEMVINIPESLISLVPAVKNIQVTFDALPGTVVPATVKEIGTEASATTRTYPVTLAMEQPETAQILPGMAGTATGEPDRTMLEQMHSSGIRVPPAALFDDTAGEKQFVWVVDTTTQTVSRREVKVGAISDRGVSILDGLEPGEVIATAGVHYLQDGQKVKTPKS
ncbi:efflux RND transporter periplasmic adaptor subunit [Nisaea sp.]|uniref:efflux RND transporter periplasmic adaptor subunit n=1 Tax=Nisaea sp. TaxID=2024842 RepID=UPI003B525132